MKIAPYIDRFGDIRKMLVDYFQKDLLKNDDHVEQAFLKNLRKKFGYPLVIKSEEEFFELTDIFLYTFKFLDNRTIIDRFVASNNRLNEEEKKIVLQWKDPVVGIFEIKELLPDGLIAENLINEVTYSIKHTVMVKEFADSAVRGKYLQAKIVPAEKDDYIFSGIQTFLEIPENELFKHVYSLQTKNPSLAFRDNEERIEQGFQMQEKDRALFMEYFGADEVLTEGRKLAGLMKDFMNYRLKKAEKSLPEGYRPPEMKLPKDLIKSRDIGIVYDDRTGQHILINYGLILDLFQNGDEEKIERFKKEILIYLEDQSIAPAILKRLFFRFPQNAEFIIRRILNRPDFSLGKDSDALIDELKPSFRGKKVFPNFLPISSRLIKAAKPEIYGQSPSKPQIGRNAPCPCGSGRKYKKCCGGPPN